MKTIVMLMFAASVLFTGVLVAGGIALTVQVGAPALIAGVVAVISLVGAVGCVMAVRAINRRDGTAYTIFTV